MTYAHQFLHHQRKQQGISTLVARTIEILRQALTKSFALPERATDFSVAAQNKQSTRNQRASVHIIKALLLCKFKPLRQQRTFKYNVKEFKERAFRGSASSEPLRQPRTPTKLGGARTPANVDICCGR